MENTDVTQQTKVKQLHKSVHALFSIQCNHVYMQAGEIQITTFTSCSEQMHLVSI